MHQKEKPVVLIAGCGDVGNRLAKKLLSHGFNVFGLRRNTARLFKGVKPIKGDLTKQDQLGDWPTNIDYVVYCAAAKSHDEIDYRQTYLIGLTNVINRLKRSGKKIRRFFFTSSTGVYHQCKGEWVDEESETLPVTMTGKAMLATEQRLALLDLPATVVRFGGIYGPGREYLINCVKEGRGYAIEPPLYGNRIHSNDCAGILHYLIECDQKHENIDGCYLGVDSCPALLNETTQWLASQLNVKIVQNITSRGRGNKRCSNRRILKAGYAFEYTDYKTGYSSLIL